MKSYETDPQHDITVNNNSLYPHINNDIEYGLFEDVVNSYYLDIQIRDDFQCNQDCYSKQDQTNADHPLMMCTHTYDHISQQIDYLTDSTQKYFTFHRTGRSLFTTDS